MRSLILFLAISMVMGCRTSEDSAEWFGRDKFQKEVHIQGIQIKNKIFESNSFKDVVVMGDQVILTSNVAPYLTVVEKDTIKQFITEGNGPGELPNPFFQTNRDEGHQLLNIFHKTTGKHYSWDPSNTRLNYEGDFSINYINLDSWDQDPFRYIGIGYFEQRYGLTDSEGKVVELYNSYPLSENYQMVSEDGRSMAYQGEFAKHPTKNLFYSATLLAPIFEILKYKNDKLNEIFTLHLDYPKVKDLSSENTISLDYEDDCEISFVSSSSTEDYIYLLYSGQKYGQSRRHSIDPYLSDQILVFDWTGEKRVSFKLDRLLKCISVDKKNRVLYGLYQDDNSLQEGMVKYYLEDSYF